MTTPDLVVSCYIGSLNIDLDGGPRMGYELHSDTRASRAVTWRKTSVDNNWVEGSYDVTAVRGNVTEVVAVWVYGASLSDFWKRVHALADQIASPAFAITWNWGGMTEIWDCTFSDYTVETQREFVYSNTGIVRMQINRRPKVSITYADSTVYAG